MRKLDYTQSPVICKLAALEKVLYCPFSHPTKAPIREGRCWFQTYTGDHLFPGPLLQKQFSSHSKHCNKGPSIVSSVCVPWSEVCLHFMMVQWSMCVEVYTKNYGVAHVLFLHLVLIYRTGFSSKSVMFNIYANGSR